VKKKKGGGRKNRENGKVLGMSNKNQLHTCEFGMIRIGIERKRKHQSGSYRSKRCPEPPQRDWRREENRGGGVFEE